jgi:hypothetical protein
LILDGDYKWFKEYLDRKDGPIQSETNMAGTVTIRVVYTERPYSEFGSTEAEAAEDWREQ